MLALWRVWALDLCDQAWILPAAPFGARFTRFDESAKGQKQSKMRQGGIKSISPLWLTRFHEGESNSISTRGRNRTREMLCKPMKWQAMPSTQNRSFQISVS
jgi:hypothetical protein